MVILPPRGCACGECMTTDNSGEMGGAGQLAQYASLFDCHHING